MHVKVRFANQNPNVKHKKRRFTSKDWIINEEFLRRRALMLQDVLFNGVQDASFVPAVGLYPMKTVEVSLLMKTPSFLGQTLIQPILILFPEM